MVAPGAPTPTSPPTRGCFAGARPGGPAHDCQQVHDEDQRRARRDQRGGRLSAVGETRGNDDLAPAADPHPPHSPVPALDDLAPAHGELVRPALFPGRVELSSGREGDAHVVNLDDPARPCLGSVPDHEVPDRQLGGRGTLRNLDPGLGQFAHHAPLARRPQSPARAGRTHGPSTRQAITLPATPTSARPHTGADHGVGHLLPYAHTPRRPAALPEGPGSPLPSRGRTRAQPPDLGR